jgi:hypothetical protein
VKGFLKHIVSLFWPVGISKPVSKAAQDDLKENISSWEAGKDRNGFVFSGDTEIRKENWRRVGPYFKTYFIRWLGVFVLMMTLGYVGPISEIKAVTPSYAIFGSLLIILTWISAVLTFVHGAAYYKYKAFLKGAEVWK